MRPTRRVRAEDGWLADEKPICGALHVWPASGPRHDLVDPAGGCPCGPMVEAGVVVHNTYPEPGLLEKLLGWVAGWLAATLDRGIERSWEED